MKVLLLAVLLPAVLAVPLDKFLEYAKLHPNTDRDNPEYGVDFEGDLLANNAADLDKVSPLNSITDRTMRWPGGVLHYKIEEPTYDHEQIKLIEAGIKDLVKTVNKGVAGKCIDIKKANKHQENYVFIVDAGGCSSYVGQIGGPQRMSLAPGCITRHGTIMHEFLHAYGFHHEQKRTDRDDYIYVNFDNIREGTENNFRKMDETELDLLDTTYDYGSVLHYSAYGFAIDPEVPTIIPHDPEAEIGQRLALSEIDIERVQIFYDCIKPENSKHFKHLKGKKIFQ